MIRTQGSRVYLDTGELHKDVPFSEAVGLMLQLFAQSEGIVVSNDMITIANDKPMLLASFEKGDSSSEFVGLYRLGRVLFHLWCWSEQDFIHPPVAIINTLALGRYVPHIPRQLPLCMAEIALYGVSWVLQREVERPALPQNEDETVTFAAALGLAVESELTSGERFEEAFAEVMA